MTTGLVESDGFVLRATGLKRSFGKVRAVDGLDVGVRAGEIYGFLGVNGAGKTTAIRMLMGIIKPEAGVITLMGEQTRRTSIRQKQSIGYVSQEQTFYPWMTGRALGRFVGGFYLNWDAQEFERLLRVLDVPADRKASQLSGGMRVKLALALALAPRPALLILDEPTSGLDPVGRREFLDIIQRQARDHGRTTFFSSHIIGEVERVADRVGIIHQGRMHFEGTLDELRASVREIRVPLPSPPPLTSIPTIIPEIGANLAPPTDPPPIPPEPTSPIAPPPIILAPEATPGLAEPMPASAAPPKLAAAPTFAVPAGFTVLRDETRDNVRSIILRASPASWETFDSNGVEVNPLSVEDIFIALAGTSAVGI